MDTGSNDHHDPARGVSIRRPILPQCRGNKVVTITPLNANLAIRTEEKRLVHTGRLLWKLGPMPTLKLHYDGWIALPAGLRQALGLNSGDRIAAELVDGTLVLRSAAKKARSAASEKVGVAVPREPEQGMLRLVDEPSAPKKIRRFTKGTDEPAAAPKRRGRPPKVVAGAEPPVPANPIVGIGPAKLVKKAERAVKPAPQELPPAPAARIRPERISQAVERQPFRNVEVRTLGPGRGHNRSRRMPSGSTV